MRSNLEDIIWAKIEAAGLTRPLVVAFITALMRVGGKLDDVRKYIDDEKLGLRLARLIRVVTAGELPPDHYLVSVSYAASPSLTNLKTVFTGGASGVWGKREWVRHRTLRNVPEMAGEMIFYLKCFGRAVTSEYVILWAESNGYHVATHLEGLAFAMADLHIQLEREYATLGASIVSGGAECVACFGSNAGKPVVGDSLVTGEWGAKTYFLLVINPFVDIEAESLSMP